MPRQTGRYRITSTLGEQVRAFVPYPLPPTDPPLAMDAAAAQLHADALAALSRLAVAGAMVPDTDWFLYGFVRKEAVITSQIEGTQATLPDIVTYEATDRAERPEDVPDTLSVLERWWHAECDLPPLVRAGLAHVQFETIHPFLDGNGRIGRLLIALLIEHWGLLDQPLLYLSVAFRRAQPEYYARLGAVRTDGDWEGWTRFFLECVREAADDGVRVARELHAIVGRDRGRLLSQDRSTVAAVRLLEHLPSNPVVTVPRAAGLLRLTAPPARKAIELLEFLGVLREISGKRRGRAYAYHEYLDALIGDDG